MYTRYMGCVGMGYFAWPESFTENEIPWVRIPQLPPYRLSPIYA